MHSVVGSERETEPRLDYTDAYWDFICGACEKEHSHRWGWDFGDAKLECCTVVISIQYVWLKKKKSEKILPVEREYEAKEKTAERERQESDCLRPKASSSTTLFSCCCLSFSH